MTRRTAARTTAAAAAVLMVAWGPARAFAADSKLPEGITPEQVAYLEESLGEGLGTGDGKLLDMAIEGLKATGKTKVQLLTSLDGAVLSAALTHSQYNDRIRIDAWELAARAKLGDERASTLLREWADAAIEMKVKKGVPTDPRARTRLRVRSARCAEALACLAYLKHEGVKELAEKVLRRALAGQAGDPAHGRMWMSFGSAQLTGAAKVLLDLDRDGAKKLFFELLDDEALPVARRTTLLQTCSQLLKGDPAGGELSGRYVKLVDGLIAKGFDGNRAPSEAMSLIRPLYQMPTDAKILGALERLRDAMPENHRRWVSHHVKSYRARLGKAAPKPQEAVDEGDDGPF